MRGVTRTRACSTLLLVAVATAASALPVRSAPSFPEVRSPERPATERLPRERPDPAAEGSWAFVGVNVLPMDGERGLLNQTVVVVDGVITRVGPAGAVEVPVDATVIDGAGRWLMPGLAEMHAHVPPVQEGRPPQQLLEDYMFLYVANGITTIRGMLGSEYQIDLKRELEDEELIGPRFFPGAPSVNGNSASTPDAAEGMIRSAVESGYDLQKIHPGVSRAAWDRMVQVAREVGLSWGGHVPVAVGLEHALRTGMSTVDHIDGYLEAAADPADPPFGGASATPGQILAGLDRGRMVELANLTAEVGAYVVPTQYLWQNLYGLRSADEVLDDPEMAYVSPQQRQAWRQQAAGGWGQGLDDVTRRDFLQARDEMLVLLAERDVVIMGTDSPQLFNVPGFALHREIDIMAEAGMTPWQILRSGTATVGRYLSEVLGEEVHTGVVREGAAADLVLLEGNPLDDLGALRERAGVMVRGRWIDGETIEAGLAAIASRHEG